MFALVADRAGRADPSELDAVARGLRAAAAPLRRWGDGNGNVAMVAGTAGILPEDRFDRQPWVDEELVFVCQARIDNRDELIDRLGISRADGSQLADSEIFHRAYRRWGADSVQQLVGDFAFAAWHRDSGRVVAGVDHFGTGRLFYSEVAGTLLLCTQLAALRRHPQISRELDLEALGLLVCPKTLPGATPFRAIRVLPGGHLIIADAGGVRLRPWWDPDTGVRIRHRDPMEYVAQAGELFRRAVKAQLRATGDVAAAMSGGLDSTLVAATAAQLLGEESREFTAYTSIPEPGLACAMRPGWEASDEAPAAAVAALHENMRHVTVAPGAAPIDGVPAVHLFSGTPVRNVGNHLWLGKISSLARASGARVLLGGDRGNVSVGAAGTEAVSELFREGRPGAAVAAAAALARGERQPFWRLLARGIAGPERFRRDRPRTRYLPGLPFLTEEFRARVEHRFADESAGLSGRRRIVSFFIKPRLAWAADPLAQWGIQWRDPTADRRLIECLLAFPSEAYIVGGRYRGLARTLGTGIVPDEVRLRRTAGAQMPEYASLLALHAQKYLSALNAVENSPLCRSIFDLGQVRHAMGELQHGSLDPFLAATIDRVLDSALFIAAQESHL